MVKINKTLKQNGGKDVEPLSLSYFAGGGEKWYNYFRKLVISYKVKYTPSS